LSALAATIHDVIVTTGIFTLFGLSFDLTALGALLAVLGYSLNDKIVVFDRLRDNFRSVRRGTVESIINVSINQVLSRTLVTGVTTLLVLVALLIFAGDTLRGFSIALFAGILIGTYSSIFVGCTLAMLMNIAPLDFAEHKRERSDDLP
jgi:preprotein translocase subunit SecF